MPSENSLFRYADLKKNKMVIFDRALKVVVLCIVISFLGKLHISEDEKKDRNYFKNDSIKTARIEFLETKLIEKYDKDDEKYKSYTKKTDSLIGIIDRSVKQLEK